MGVRFGRNTQVTMRGTGNGWAPRNHAPQLHDRLRDATLAVNPMNEGTCALCLRHQPLARSHILPEWGYGDIYDPRHHRGHALSAGPGARVGHVKKGIREP